MRVLYDVNLNFFDEIDTEEKAYYLGMWYADGNVVDDKIRLQLADLEIVEGAKKALKYTGPLYTIPPQGEGRKIQYCLSISRRELVNALINKGCPSKKSLILTFPSSGIVPDHLIGHFIRGWFDGDGNIYYHQGQKKWKLQLVGTKEFLEGICNTIDCSGYWSQRHPDRRNNNWNFTIAKNDQVIKFLEFIYKDYSISLNRKKLQKEECISYLKSRQSKILSKNDKTKYINNKIEEIKLLRIGGMSFGNISKKLNINKATVMKIIKQKKR